MARFLKIAALLGIGLVLVFGALLFTFYRLVQIGEFRGFLISEVERQTRLKVRVGEARLRMGSMMGSAFAILPWWSPGTTSRWLRPREFWFASPFSLCSSAGWFSTRSVYTSRGCGLRGMKRDNFP